MQSMQPAKQENEIIRKAIFLHVVTNVDLTMTKTEEKHYVIQWHECC